MEKRKKAGTAAETGTKRQENETAAPKTGTGAPENGTGGGNRPPGAEENTAPAQPRLFTKGQLAASERFRGRRDLVEALLDEKGLYTAEDAEGKIENYMKGRAGQGC